MNGIILIDKPKEYTSHDVVAVVKRISKEKVGHTGTLDPMATGVLPLLVGKATGISKYLINHDKIYIATLKLGKKTDTADSEGNVIEEKVIPELSNEMIIKVLGQMTGKQEQTPPMYSAIKINGKKLYEYARQGKTVEVAKRRIEIYEMKLLEFKEEEAEITFEISCSKGTYIRTVCESIAEELNTVGYMQELRRIRVGKFDISKTVNIEDIKQNENLLREKMISIEELFKQKAEIDLTNQELELFLNGVKLHTNNTNEIYRIYNQGVFIGLGIVENNQLKRDVIV